MNHWPFIIAAYAAFTILMFADALLPTLARRRALREARARAAREATRRNK